jgi:hypothetical protein
MKAFSLKEPSMTARIACLSLFLLSAAFSASLAQDMAPPKPGKEHELLKQFEGEWDCTSKFTMPGSDPVISKAKETARLMAGGLFLVFDVEGEMMGAKFAGHGTMGYDTHKRKYTGSWIDSMATGVYLVEGTYDEQTKVFTELMEGSDPGTGQPMKMKVTHEIKDKDNRILKFFMNGPEGKEIQTGTIEYKRKK